MKKLTVREIARLTLAVTSVLVVGSVLCMINVVWPIDWGDVEF